MGLLWPRPRRSTSRRTLRASFVPRPVSVRPAPAPTLPPLLHTLPRRQGRSVSYTLHRGCRSRSVNGNGGILAEEREPFLAAEARLVRRSLKGEGGSAKVAGE